jgi:beta-glucosidase
MTFPRNVGQIPIFYNSKNLGRPFDAEQKYTSKYIDIPITALYPFGYGLSYTDFEYSNLSLSSTTLNQNGKITVSVNVKNTGDVTGSEVVQLYIRDMVASVTRPVRELKGFEKIKLEPGQMENVTFTITPKQLKFYTRNMDFKTESGDFRVFVGGDSNAGLSKSFTLK